MLPDKELYNIIDKTYDELSDADKMQVNRLYQEEIIKKNTSKDLLKAYQKALFAHIPPSAEEFLDPSTGFLPYEITEGLFSHVKSDFIATMDPIKNYPTICLYGSTRSGKSVFGRLITIYTIVYINYLKDPHMYYGVNKMSPLSLWLLSFKDEKTREVLLAPILQILRASTKFTQEHFERQVHEKGVSSEGIIHYSEAGKFGAITFPKLQIATGRDPSSIVGSDIIAGVISEITFFKQYVPGISDEDVKEVYTKLSNRIKTTIGHTSFPCWTYLDSSANDASSPLEYHISHEIKQNPRAHFKQYVLWEVRPNLAPQWNEDKTKTFKVCTGDGSYPPKVITDARDLKEIPAHLIIDVPVDFEGEFRRDVISSIKDIAGRPTVSESKFIQNGQLIDALFDDMLDNIEGIIVCDSKDKPEEYIWSKIMHKFFVMYDGVNYCLKRAPQEPRYIGVDLAHSAKGDIAGISMLHKEALLDGTIIYVTDFAFAIGPGENGINLEAIQFFIRDLFEHGHVNIAQVNVDTFQSENLVQFLIRNEINAVKSSVDRTLNPYMCLFSNMLDGTIIVGKNIFLKNNLNSLYRTKTADGKREKIDHAIGQTVNVYRGDFETSTCGVYAKDVADSFVQALFAASEDEDTYPNFIFKEPKKTSSKSKKKVQVTQSQTTNTVIDDKFCSDDYRNNLSEAMKILNRKF